MQLSSGHRSCAA